MHLEKVFGTEKADRIGDIVFIHGLNGSHWDSWVHRHDDSDDINYWPDSLGKELAEFGVWAVSYEAAPSNWLGSTMPLIDRANSVLDLLDANGVGERPLFLIAHSFGGLIAKQILRSSKDHNTADPKFLLHLNTKGIVFFSTPHTGSDLANLAKLFRVARASAMVADLEKNNVYLRDLGAWFRANAQSLNYSVISYVETKKTSGLTVVDQTSGDPHLDFSRAIPFDGDHHAICKIAHNGDHRFKQIVKLMRRCVQSTKSNEPSKGILEKVDFDIKVVENPPNDGMVSDKYPKERVVRYYCRNQSGSLVVTPTVDYVDNMERIPLEGIHYYWNPFHCQYPNLDVTVVNNRAESLALSEAVFEVESSTTDLSPVIIFKDNNVLMKLGIINEGWGKLCNPFVECNLLPTNASEVVPDPPIDHIEIKAPFKFRFDLEDFAESTVIDLSETFRTLGVRIDEIAAAGFQSQQMRVLYAMQNGLDRKLQQHYGRFPKLETNEAWAAFPDGYAVVAGRLCFDGLDRNGQSKPYAIPFKVRVFLFNVRYDLPRPPSYQYQVELEPEGNNYSVACPVSHSFAPGEVDRFQIRISCARSAIHALRIRWRFAGGREIESPKIQLTHFVPRTFSKEQTEGAKVGECWPEVETQDHGEGIGCIEASLLQCMQIMAARDAMLDSTNTEDSGEEGGDPIDPQS